MCGCYHVARHLQTQEENKDLLQRQQQELEVDDELNNSLALERRKNAALQEQINVLQGELQEWCTENGGGVVCKECELRAAREGTNQADTVGGDMQEELQVQNEEIEALRREIEETDAALRSAEMRIMQLESEQQQDRKRSDSKDEQIALLNTQLQQRPHTMSGEGANGTVPGMQMPWNQGPCQTGCKPDIAPIVEEEACDWEYSSMSSDEDVQRLSNLLHSKDKEMQRREEERDRQVETLQWCIREKDAAIHSLEVQLSIAYQEAKTLTSKLNEGVHELKMQVAENQKLKLQRETTFLNNSATASTAFPVETYSRLNSLCCSLLNTFSTDPLALYTPDSGGGTAAKNKTTVGLYLKNTSVDDLVVGGPGC